MEDFVPFELAVKLREKGFNEQCLAYYTEDTEFYYNTSYGSDVESAFKSFNSKPDTICGKRIDAPTISQVLKWLRKEKKIHIVCPFYEDKGFYYYVQKIGNAARIVSSFDDSDDCFDSAEQAALAGIEYVIDNLI